MICAGCSTSNSPPLPAYQGIPAGMMERCIVRDVPLETTGDIVESRRRYKEGFETCAARVDAIREHDKKAWEAMTSSEE